MKNVQQLETSLKFRRKRMFFQFIRKRVDKLKITIDLFLYYLYVEKFSKSLVLTASMNISQMVNQLITPNQSGFRAGDSTISQLLYITHSIHTALKNIHHAKQELFFWTCRKHLIKFGMKASFSN